MHADLIETILLTEENVPTIVEKTNRTESELHSQIAEDIGRDIIRVVSFISNENWEKIHKHLPLLIEANKTAGITEEEFLERINLQINETARLKTELINQAVREAHA